ncbi:MAG: exopolysaccharide biosynthesis protein [Parachlamydiaceae bacterium]|nr:exopolysaccharide biosynthesis protein [Parachlamydiaceae bacterium]
MKNPKKDLELILENDLVTLVEKAKSKPITVQQLLDTLSGRGYPLLALILSLPFCQPIQIPGFSIPFGLLIMFIGIHMAFPSILWWPKWLLKREIPLHVLEMIVEKSRWLMQKLDKILRPCFLWISTNPVMSFINAMMIAMMGFFMMLPLPIPLSNIIAAWSIILIGLGIIGKDGFFIGMGYLLGFICIGLIIFIVAASIHYIGWLIF